MGDRRNENSSRWEQGLDLLAAVAELWPELVEPLREDIADLGRLSLPAADDNDQETSLPAHSNDILLALQTFPYPYPAWREAEKRLRGLLGKKCFELRYLRPGTEQEQWLSLAFVQYDELNRFDFRRPSAAVFYSGERLRVRLFKTASSEPADNGPEAGSAEVQPLPADRAAGGLPAQTLPGGDAQQSQWASYEEVKATVDEHGKATEGRLQEAAKTALPGQRVRREHVRKAIGELWGRPGRQGRPKKSRG